MLLSTGTKKGWYNGADAISTAAFWVGNLGRRAVCLHVVEGTYQGAVSVFKGEAAKKSAHFLISRAGHIAQFVSVYDSSWANGLSWSPSKKCWQDPEGAFLDTHPPTWVGLTPPKNPNKTAISVEEEGMHTEPRTAAQVAARLSLLQWIAAQFPGSFSPYVPLVNLIGHCHISPINRANCPGKFIDYAAIASDANGPSPLTRYRAPQVGVHHRRECDDVPFTYLVAGGEYDIDMPYPDGIGHLASGLGFVRLSQLERV